MRGNYGYYTHSLTDANPENPPEGYLDDGDHETPPLPPQCERCGTDFGPVSLEMFTDQFGQTEQEMVGALLIGGRWVCPICEPYEYEDYYAELTDWAAMHEDNQFESQREEAF